MEIIKINSDIYLIRRLVGYRFFKDYYEYLSNGCNGKIQWLTDHSRLDLLAYRNLDDVERAINIIKFTENECDVEIVEENK